MYDFANELYFHERALGEKSNRDKPLMRLLKSPGVVDPRLVLQRLAKKNLSQKLEFYHLIPTNHVLG